MYAENWIFAAGTFIVTLFVAAVTGVWALGRNSQQQSEKTDQVKLELERRINDETDNAVKQFGESVTAIRQKVIDMELWNRDNFVKKDTFQLVVNEIRDTYRRLEDTIGKRFDRIDARLSKMTRGDYPESN